MNAKLTNGSDICKFISKTFDPFFQNIVTHSSFHLLFIETLVAVLRKTFLEKECQQMPGAFM